MSNNFITIKNCNNNNNFKALKDSGNVLENVPNWNGLMFSEESLDKAL